THVVAGPFATRILGDLGAHVVKVHSAARNSGARAVDNPAYLMWNRNKRALALNMSTEEARALCRRLAARADVVIENFSPDVLAPLEARRGSGRGQRIEIAQLGVGVHLVAPALLDYFATGRIAGPTGNQPPFAAAAPHDCYPCKGDDRWVAIAVAEDTQWQR